MRPYEPISVRPKLPEPDDLGSRVSLPRVLLLLELGPYSGPTFLDVLPDAPPIWKSPWLLLLDIPLLPAVLVGLLILDLAVDGTDLAE
jgi:hypothetical protein